MGSRGVSMMAIPSSAYAPMTSGPPQGMLGNSHISASAMHELPYVHFFFHTRLRTRGLSGRSVATLGCHGSLTSGGYTLVLVASSSATAVPLAQRSGSAPVSPTAGKRRASKRSTYSLILIIKILAA